MRFETERCLVRPFIEADLDDFMAYRNDMAWMLYQDFKGLSREAYKAALVGESVEGTGDSPAPKQQQLAIVSKETNRVIGDLYIKAEADCRWIGYTITPACARQGYASETVTGLIAALKAEGAACIKANIDPGNVASIALLRKLGFIFESNDYGDEVYVLPLQ